MKRLFYVAAPIVIAVLAIVALASMGQGNIAFAAKPQKVVEWSNGFPSGEHFNLNIHGKKVDYNCDPAPGGGSVFVPEYGTSEIQYIQNKRSSITELSVLDRCAEFDGDAAKVQLPTGEYQVYARILAKPSKKDEERSVVFYPKLIDACDFLDELDPSLGGDEVDCSNETVVGLGIVTKDGAFDKDGQELVRIAPVKGKNKAVEITDLFQWSGYACDAAFDTNGDGEITVDDVLVDLNGDLVIDELDLALYLDQNCTLFESEWIFNIADIVVYGWDYHNNGSKLVQVRFYPR